MVKGISRQVIVVESPDPKLFDQAIFILKDGMEGITDEALLKEARQLIRSRDGQGKRHLWRYGAFWAGAGALATGAAWLVTALI